MGEATQRKCFSGVWNVGKAFQVVENAHSACQLVQKREGRDAVHVRRALEGDQSPQTMWHLGRKNLGSKCILQGLLDR